MRISTLLTSFLLIVVLGCSKDKGCTSVPPEDEAPQIAQYITDNNLIGVSSTKGVYYQIIDNGSGVSPTINSIVDVLYRGKYLNGQVFEESSSIVSFPLNKVIEGWQIGIPLIKKGGKINLIIPSAYGYGCVGNSPIPPNTILYFEISLIDVR